MVTILAITCLLLFAGISRCLERSLLYPPFAMAGCWALLLFLHACSGLLLPLHEETLCFYVAGAVAFCLGGFVVHFFYPPGRASVAYDRSRVRNILTIFLLILTVGFPSYLSFITGLVGDWGSGSLWASGGFWVILRQRLIEEQAEALGGFSGMDNLVVIADVTALIAWYHRDTEKWRAGAAFAFFLAYNLLTAGRAGFVSILLALFAIEVIRRRRVPWRPMVALALVFVVAFFGLALLVGKAGANTNDSLSESAPVLIDGLELYAVGSLVAFDHLYLHPGTIPPTQNIDRNFRILAGKFGFRSEVPYLHADFRTVGAAGIGTNTYTIYFTYFPQLGTAGSLAMMLLLGVMVTGAYCRAAGGEPQAVILFATLFYGIPLSGYSENYFLNLNFLTKMALVLACCYRSAARPAGHSLAC